jgi:hypothetical protein
MPHQPDQSQHGEHANYASLPTCEDQNTKKSRNPNSENTHDDELRSDLSLTGFIDSKTATVLNEPLRLFGGGGYYGMRSGYYGGRAYGGGLTLIVVIVVLVLLFGGGLRY